MAQQSTTEPRGTEKTTGPRTREQRKAIIEKRERSDGVEVDPHARSLAEARRDTEQPAGEFEISHGDRSIQRGANQESEHHKRRQQ
ncbi:hypothetical protein ACFOOL_10285 [Devosia honganensis]|uniref:Stress-induced protein n=1 Tax=Devosia honganensis TaxID=1610527 RepID=A0ABV7X1X1_9HYPH